ncbi:MAG: hypothetical protein HQM14_06205 [SAR324 cluster bacterium]|nr:hypothetical protein [SAR324 cluster bacterium]
MYHPILLFVLSGSGCAIVGGMVGFSIASNQVASGDPASTITLLIFPVVFGYLGGVIGLLAGGGILLYLKKIGFLLYISTTACLLVPVIITAIYLF